MTQLEPTESHKPAATYQRVLDGRKQPLRGLWRRNGAFYARLTVEDDFGRKETRRVRLNAKTIPEAQKELYKLRDQRDENTLPVLDRAPKLQDYTVVYFNYLAMTRDSKRESTIEKERCAIKKWNAHIGHVRLDKIRTLHISSYIAQRQGKGRAARTVNLDVIMLRNVLKKARENVRRLDDERIGMLLNRHDAVQRMLRIFKILVPAREIDELGFVFFHEFAKRA